jgi:hypothetical protein
MTKALAFCSLFFLPLIPPACARHRSATAAAMKNVTARKPYCNPQSHRLNRERWRTYRGRARQRRSRWAWRRRQSPTTAAPSSPGSCPARRRVSWRRIRVPGRTPRWCPCMCFVPKHTQLARSLNDQLLLADRRLVVVAALCSGDGDGDRDL